MEYNTGFGSVIIQIYSCFDEILSKPLSVANNSNEGRFIAMDVLRNTDSYVLGDYIRSHVQELFETPYVEPMLNDIDIHACRSYRRYISVDFVLRFPDKHSWNLYKMTKPKAYAKLLYNEVKWLREDLRGLAKSDY